MSREQFFRKRWAGSTPIGAVVPTVCGKPGTSGGPRSTEVVHSYGDLRGLRAPPSNLFASANGMLRPSILQWVDVVASTIDEPESFIKKNIHA